MHGRRRHVPAHAHSLRVSCARPFVHAVGACELEGAATSCAPAAPLLAAPALSDPSLEASLAAELDFSSSTPKPNRLLTLEGNLASPQGTVKRETTTTTATAATQIAPQAAPTTATATATEETTAAAATTTGTNATQGGSETLAQAELPGSVLPSPTFPPSPQPQQQQRCILSQ